MLISYIKNLNTWGETISNVHTGRYKCTLLHLSELWVVSQRNVKQKMSLFKGYQNCPQELKKQGRKKKRREKKEKRRRKCRWKSRDRIKKKRGKRRKRKKKSSQNHTKTMSQK